MPANSASAPLPAPDVSFPPGLFAAVVILAAVSPGVLMMAPAVATQLHSQWQLSTLQIGHLFSCELGGMSAATLPAWWWSGRINWRKIALLAGVVFILGNLLSALTLRTDLLMICRFIASLAGGTLMILSITCAAAAANTGRIYAYWVLGQLLLGTVGLLALPPLFSHFGLAVVYLLLAFLMLCSLPLLRYLPAGFHPPPVSAAAQIAPSRRRKLCAILAVLLFYVSLSAVWTFIGEIAVRASLSALQSGDILAVATVVGIIGAVGAAMMAARFRPGTLLWIGYVLLVLAIMLLVRHPMAIRFVLAAIIFKFTWTFLAPFTMAHVAALDNDGKLMNNINLVIGGGMALGPSLGATLLTSFGGMDALLTGALASAVLSGLLLVDFS